MTSELNAALHSSDRFKLLVDDGIKDSFAKVIWMPQPPKKMIPADIIKYCEDNGYLLPTIEELYSLVNNSEDPCVFPVFKDLNTDGWYLSSTKTSWNKDHYRCVSFYYGDVDSYYENDEYYVCPVRASQS